MAVRDDAVTAFNVMQADTWEASLLGSVPAKNTRLGRTDNAFQFYDSAQERAGSQAAIAGAPETATYSDAAVSAIKLWLDTLYELPT